MAAGTTSNTEVRGFEIRFTEGAIKDLRWFHSAERRMIIAGIELQLALSPAAEARNRKPLNSAGFTAWALRVGRFRVFYSVDAKNGQVRVEAIGRRRSGRMADGKKAPAKGTPVRKENVVLRPEDDDLIIAGIDDFEREIELTRASGALMEFIEERSRRKAAISLERAKARLDIAAN